MSKLDSIVEQLSVTPKKIFLIDGLGAFFTTFLSLTVLIRFEDYFDMPTKIVYLLALIGAIYMVYSFSCYFIVKHNYPPYLMLIALANLFYCCFILALVCYFYKSLTILGIGYFLFETLVIGFLVLIELKLSKQLAGH